MSQAPEQQPVAEPVFLTPQQVSDRYGGQISIRTLANWRTNGDGPKYVKIGGRVMYKPKDLESWETKRTFDHNSRW